MINKISIEKGQKKAVNLEDSQALKKENNIDIIISKNNNSVNLNKFPYISISENEKNGKITYKILCPELAEHIRKNTNYLFVRDNATQEPRRYFYKNGYYKLVNDDEIKGFIKSFIPLFMQKICDIKEVMGLLYTDLKYVDEDILDSNENIINFKNGVLELDTLTLRPHTAEDFCTTQINSKWNITAQRPNESIFEYFMNFLSGEDQEIQLFLLEYIGVCISNIKGYRMKKALFMVGKSNAGKSQLKTLTEKLLGKGNYSGADLQTLESRFGETNAYNKRLVGSSDMSFVTVDELKTFKLLTGGDSINAEFKGKNFFEFTFKGLLWFCCNKLPKFGGDKGDPIFNRMVVIECNNVSDNLDPLLMDKMLVESEYIIKMCVLALKKVIDNGYSFDIPSKSTTAVQNFKVEINSSMLFFKECTESIDKNYRIRGVKPKDFYNIYSNWCKSNGYKYPQSKREIAQILQDLEKDELHKADGIRYYKHFTLTSDTFEDYKTEFKENQNPFS